MRPETELTTLERQRGEALAPPAPSRGVRLAAVLGVRDAGRVLRDFATYLPTHAIPALAGFLVLPILARRLFPTDLGVLAIAQTLASLGWTVTANWLAAAIVREFPAHRRRGDYLSFTRRLWRGLGIASAAFLAFSGILVVGGLYSSAIGDNLPFILWAVAGLALENLAIAMFAASLRPRAYALFEVGGRVLGVGLGVILVFEGYGVAGYLVGLASFSTLIGVVGLAVGWPRGGEQPRPAEPPRVRPWLRYGVPASAAATALWGMNFIDRYILAVLENAGAVGVYTVGNVIGDKVVSIPSLAFFAAASPLLFTAFERQGRAEVERLMRSYTRIVLLFGLPAIAFVGAVADDLISLLTGLGVYQDGAQVAPIVAAGALLYALAAVATTGLSIARRTKPLIYSGSIGLTANVLANFLLIPPLGILGAAIATPIGTGTYLAATYLWARPHASWHFPFGTLLRAASAALAAYGAALLVMSLTHSDVGDIGGAMFSGGIVYLLALALLGERRGSERTTSA